MTDRDDAQSQPSDSGEEGNLGGEYYNYGDDADEGEESDVETSELTYSVITNPTPSVLRQTKDQGLF